MSTLLEQERERYELAWGMIEVYTTDSPGEKYVPLFLDMTHTTMAGSVIDAGCGAGKAALLLEKHGFYINGLCDITDAGLVEEAKRFPFHNLPLWANLKREMGFADWVYCSDVVEHLPKELTMLAVQRMLECAKRGVFLSIALVPDALGAWLGADLHQTVESFVWWRDNLNVIGRVKECRDLLYVGVYLVEPKDVE